MSTIKFKNSNGEWEEITASRLTTPRTINGVPFDGSQSITIPAGSGVESYTELTNKPQINGVELGVFTSLDDLGIEPKRSINENYVTDNEKININTIPSKVDKIDGKGLSTNDFTNEYKGIVDTHPVDQNNPHKTSITNLEGFPVIPTNTKFLRDDKSFSEIIAGSGGYAANIYLTNTDSDISGYKKISYSVEPAEFELVTTATNQTVLVKSYLYDAGVGLTVLDSGPWDFYLRCKLDSVVNSNKIRVDVFKRDVSDVETVLFSATSDEITNTNYTQLHFQNIQQNISVIATDRIGVKLYFITTNTNPVSLSVTIGDGNASYFTTPLALRHSQLRLPNEDLNVQHMTANEKTKLSGIAAGAEVNVQSDWNVIDTNSDAFIKNKPIIPDISGKVDKVSSGQSLPIGINTLYDTLVKIGIDQNADITSLLANTSNALFNALASASKDTLVEIIKWLIENKIDTASTVNEWGVGVTLPGQKEVMGLLLKMIVSDGYSIVVPVFPQKTVVLTAAGQIQLLNDSYAGKYYVIKNAYLVARNLSGVTQYPTFSIGCNASYNDIAASQTLNTLANGVNAIALTPNASKALIEANANMVLNITTPLIGSGTFILVLEGMIC